MPKFPALTPREVVRILERGGFTFVRQKGSHRMYVKGHLRVTVAYHNAPLKRRTLKHIIKQSGLDLKDFLAP